MNRCWSALRKLSVVFTVWLAFWSVSASSQALPAENAFAAFQEDVHSFADYIAWMEKSYANAAAPLLNRLNAVPEPWYRPQLDLLLKVSTPINTQQTRVDWLFSKWAEPFKALSRDLATQWQASRNAVELQPLFFAVHDAYVHAVPSAYLLIAGVKEKYIEAPWGPAFASARERDLAIHHVTQLHLWTQRIIGWMRQFHTAADYTGLAPATYFAAGEPWEVRYQLNFFIGMSATEVLSAVEDFGLFFIPVAAAEEWKEKLSAAGVKLVPAPGLPPVVTPPPVAPPPVNPPPVNPPVVTPPPVKAPTLEELRREYEEIQKKLADRQNQDNAALRQRLWELQKLLNPAPAPTTPTPVTPNPGQNPGQGTPSPQPPTTNPAPGTPAPVTPAPVTPKPTEPPGGPAPLPPKPTPPKAPDLASGK